MQERPVAESVSSIRQGQNYSSVQIDVARKSEPMKPLTSLSQGKQMLSGLLDRGKRMIEDRALSEQRFQSWSASCVESLKKIFGDDTTFISSFYTAGGDVGFYVEGATAADDRADLERRLVGRIDVLSGAIEFIDLQISTGSVPSLNVESHASALHATNMQNDLDLFISHSGKDKNIAEALIELIKAATGISANRIRCTSVDGYRLPGGVNSDERLKKEVREAMCFIGLITQNSLRSSYVLFELGARWGAGLHFVPLLAGGATVRDLGAPLVSLNALNCSSTSQLHQFVGELAERLGLQLINPAVYEKHAQNLREVSDRAAGEHAAADATATLTQLSGNPANRMEPVSEGGRALLKLAQESAPAGERGIVEIKKEIIVGQRHFFPKIQYSGGPLGMKSRTFRESVAELVTMGWLLSPEDNESTGTRTYEYIEP